MLPRLFSRVTRVAIGAALLVTFGVQVAAAAARPEPGARRQRGFSLFADVFTVFLVNRVACGVNNLGEICVDPGNSPIGGGGFWPRGTPDQYIFNTGLQVAGIIPADAGFEWAGDTVGAYFMDPRGTQSQGEGVTPVYNSLDPVDAADWPSGAVVRDTAVYAPVLIGRNNISQQDLWVRSWDGNPNLLSGRTHPMGVLVEMRGLGWNFPSGNEDILYFVFDVYNVTATDPAAYGTLDPAIQSEIAAIGANFQAGVQATLGVNIPDGGYAFTSTYAAFFADMDVEDASHNYATAILPFNLGIAYKNDWLAALWGNPDAAFPASIFGPPFAKAPGFVGVKYLKSPNDPNTGEELGLTMFSNTLNSASGFPDPVGVIQLWRYLSGNVNAAAGDNPCTVAAPIQRRLCYLGQDDVDVRFFQSSGPFRLEPGQKVTIVVAYGFGAPVASAISIGQDTPPGIPEDGARFAGTAQPRDVERAAGWVSHSDVDGNGVVTQEEVVTVPRSLLDKSLVAQAVFDNKFLLPFAPEPPTFYLIPGNDQVTIVWQPSPTETNGDPFFGIASDPTSALFDPNFREIDVEGYRIYRGRTAGALELVAQFDYENTTFEDFTGAINYGNCAPELGIVGASSDCPVNFAFPISNAGPSNPVDIEGDLVQALPGGRVVLVDGTTVLTISADTAVTGGGSTNPAPSNTGVPFAFVDRGVRNSLTYFYAVTAFDVNSVASGPSSLESAPIARSVTPRSIAGNQVAAGEVLQQLVGGNGQVIDTEVDPPTVDATTGTFSGPAAPTSYLSQLAFELFSDQALQPNFEASIRIDSIVPEWYHLATYYVTTMTPTDTQALALGPIGPLGVEDGTVTLGPFDLLVPANQEAATAAGFAGLPFSARSRVSITLGPTVFFSKDADWHPDVDGSFFGETGVTDVGGSRWFDGDNESMADPTLGESHGQLTGVTAIYRPVRIRNASNLFRRYDQFSYHLFRAADIKIYWGSTPGTVDSVIDVTHHIPVPFDPQYRASYGFVADVAGANDGDVSAPNGMLTYNDVLFGACLLGTGTGVNIAGCNDRDLTPAATLTNVDVTGDQVSDGQGFGLYINGEPFIFQAAALPSSTTWTYRSYVGELTQDGDGNYAFDPQAGEAPIPGLSFRIATSTAATYPDSAVADLSRVHTVPDPYYVTSAMEITTNRKVLKFVNLPTKAIIRIYSLSGVLINIVEHNDVTGGGEATWNLRNRNNQFVASGVYFYHVETPTGNERVGRFTVVNFAQ
jgi:hypothetical protein